MKEITRRSEHSSAKRTQLSASSTPQERKAGVCLNRRMIGTEVRRVRFGHASILVAAELGTPGKKAVTLCEGWSIESSAAEDGPHESEAHDAGNDVADHAEPTQLDAEDLHVGTELKEFWKGHTR